MTDFLETNGARIAYDVAGSGEPVVLIHAGVANRSMWDDQVEALADAYRVIRHDTRGFGETETEAVPFSNRGDIGALLDHLGERSAHIAGLSRGANIALDFALEFPERVRSLTVVAGGVGGYESPAELPQGTWQAVEAMEEARDWEALTDWETAFWADGPGQSPDRVPEVRRRVHDWVLSNYRAEKVEGEPQPLDPPAETRLADLHVAPAGDARDAGRSGHGGLDAPSGRFGARGAARGVRVGAHGQPRASRAIQPGASRVPRRARRGIASGILRT